MNEIKISSDKSKVLPQEAIDLWVKLKWGSRDDYEEGLVGDALKNTTFVLSARDENNKLVGLARVLSDGVFNTALADIVVDPDYQKRGIGTKMMEKIKEQYKKTGIYIEAFQQNENFFQNCGYTKQSSMAVYSKKFA